MIYKLTSTALIHTPGIIRYARVAYETGSEILARNIIESYEGIPFTAQTNLLKGIYLVDGDAVHVSDVPDEAPNVGEC